MPAINTNISSLRTQAALSQNDRALQNAMQQLSTGKRINSAGDDAAGLAIASSMGAQIKSLNQEVRNANDGISLLQTAEGATSTITTILQRMRELAIQAQNNTYQDSDRTSMQTEVTALMSEIGRIASATKWNNMSVLDGSFTSKQVLIGDTSTVDISGTNMSTSTGLSLSGLSVSSVTGAASALTSIDTALGTVSTARATMGATINRLQYTVDNLTNISTNLSASKSRIEDTDYSQATAELAKRQVIQQAATAMLAQANQQPQTILSLLK